MKKVCIVSFVIALAFNFSACKSEVKKEENKAIKAIVKKEKKNVAFSLKEANNKINFTAYKTTEKIPVGGQFNKVEITNGGEGNTIKEAINNTDFSIPVSSIFTKDSSRDYKIKKFFFGIMDNTKLLSGKLMIQDNVNGVAEIKMNGVTAKLPFTYTIVDKTFSMEATMDVNNWNALEALASLNKVCYELHKGTDGVSKTWNDVAIKITSTF